MLNIFSYYYLMTSKYIPSIYKLPSSEFDISSSTVITGNAVNQPLISLGFHSFIHRTKSAMDLIKKLQKIVCHQACLMPQLRVM
jgi:hypothetical protein